LVDEVKENLTTFLLVAEASVLIALGPHATVSSHRFAIYYVNANIAEIARQILWLHWHPGQERIRP